MSTDTLPRCLTTAEASDLLGVHAATLRDLAHRGELHPVRINQRNWRWPEDDLRRFIDERS